MNQLPWPNARSPDPESIASLAEEHHNPAGIPRRNLSGPAADLFVVNLRFKSHHNAAAAEIEHRPLDHRRLLEHQRDGLLLVDARLGPVGQLLERGAGAIQQRLPAGLLRPALDAVAVDAAHLVVMEAVVDAALEIGRAS